MSRASFPFHPRVAPVPAPGAAAWHLVTSEYPPDVGGVSGYTWQLARAVASAGDEVHVWCPGPARPSGAGVAVHPELGSMSWTDLRRLDAQLDAYPAPRRLLVQWVPHGFGYRSMNLGFCLWLARRARHGDRVELMVHEPYMEFNWRSPSHSAMAAVHRLMTLVILSAACRVWIAIPAWEACLRRTHSDVTCRWRGCPFLAASSLGRPWTRRSCGRGMRRPTGRSSVTLARMAPLSRRCSTLVCQRLWPTRRGRRCCCLAPTVRYMGRADHAASRLARPCARYRLPRRSGAGGTPARVRPVNPAIPGRRHFTPDERDGLPVAGAPRGDHPRAAHRAPVVGERCGGTRQRRRSSVPCRGSRPAPGRRRCSGPPGGRRPPTLRRYLFAGLRRHDAAGRMTRRR